MKSTAHTSPNWANQCACVCAQSCLTLRPHGLSLPGSSAHGVFQVRILEWVAIPFSRGSSQTRDQTQISCTAGAFFTREAWPTCRLKNSPKKSQVTAIWSPIWEKVLGTASTPWMRPQIAVSGVPIYNPRLQTDIISLHAKIHLWFYFNIFTMLFVLYCES